MKKFVIVSCAAVLMAGYYVWGSTPASHIVSDTQISPSAIYVSDTVPTKKDTTGKKWPSDTTKRDTTSLISSFN